MVASVVIDASNKTKYHGDNLKQQWSIQRTQQCSRKKVSCQSRGAHGQRHAFAQRWSILLL